MCKNVAKSSVGVKMLVFRGSRWMAGAWSKMQKCQHLIKLDVEIDEKISTRKKVWKKTSKGWSTSWERNSEVLIFGGAKSLTKERNTKKNHACKFNLALNIFRSRVNKNLDRGAVFTNLTPTESKSGFSEKWSFTRILKFCDTIPALIPDRYLTSKSLANFWTFWSTKSSKMTVNPR